MNNTGIQRAINRLTVMLPHYQKSRPIQFPSCSMHKRIERNYLVFVCRILYRKCEERSVSATVGSLARGRVNIAQQWHSDRVAECRQQVLDLCCDDMLVMANRNNWRVNGVNNVSYVYILDGHPDKNVIGCSRKVTQCKLEISNQN